VLIDHLLSESDLQSFAENSFNSQAQFLTASRAKYIYEIILEWDSMNTATENQQLVIFGSGFDSRAWRLK
jgi:O-methyltransferase involved in polyketide biosynthesis